MTTQQYRNLGALNQSLLSRLDYGVSGYHNYMKEREADTNRFKPSQALKLGSLVDWALTGEEGKYIYVESLPSTSSKDYAFMVKYVNRFLEDEMAIFSVDTIVQEIYDEVGFKRDSLEKVKLRINWDAIYKILDDPDALLITKADKELADSIVNSFRTHEHTKDIFNTRHNYQVPIVWYHKDIMCKGLIDMLYIDHKNKIIIPRDIKTSGSSTIKFKESIQRFRYDIQAAWYIMGLKALYPKYEIKNFQFLVESTKWQGCPLIYELDHACLEQVYEEIDQLVDLYKWHEINGWSVDREVALNKGHLVIKSL